MHIHYVIVWPYCYLYWKTDKQRAYRAEQTTYLTLRSEDLLFVRHVTTTLSLWNCEKHKLRVSARAPASSLLIGYVVATWPECLRVPPPCVAGIKDHHWRHGINGSSYQYLVPKRSRTQSHWPLRSLVYSSLYGGTSYCLISFYVRIYAFASWNIFLLLYDPSGQHIFWLHSTYEYIYHMLTIYL
jgi:hypothetical protein